MDERGGLSWKRGAGLFMIVMLLYGITAFVYEHASGPYLDHYHILFFAVVTMIFTAAIFILFLRNANEDGEMEQKKISKWIMGAVAVFMALLSCEICGVLNFSLLGDTLSLVFFDFPKTYLYEVFNILIFPAAATYIVKAIGDNSLSSTQAKTAILQIVVITFMEFLLFSTLDSIWMVEMALFNVLTLIFAVNNSQFGKALKPGDKTALFVSYAIFWLALLLVYSSNEFLRPEEYFYGNDWKIYSGNIKEIVRHSSWLGPSQALIRTVNVRRFMQKIPVNLIVYLLFYGGWMAVMVYIGVLIVFLHILRKALCVGLKKYNPLYVVYHIAFLNMVIRSVSGILNGLGILPIPVNLPLSTELGVIADTFCITLIACHGILNRWIYWQCCADSHVVLQEEMEWLEMERFDEFDEVTEDEEEFDDDEAIDETDLQFKELWAMHYERKKGIKEHLKESKFLVGVTIFLTLVVVLGTWHGVLSWVDNRIPGMNEYELLDELQKDDPLKAEGVIQL